MESKEKIMHQIAKDIDELDTFEKHFALWLLLREYEHEDLKVKEHADTVEEYMEMIFKRDISVSVNHLIELLGYELF